MTEPRSADPAPAVGSVDGGPAPKPPPANPDQTGGAPVDEIDFDGNGQRSDEDAGDDDPDRTDDHPPDRGGDRPSQERPRDASS